MSNIVIAQAAKLAESIGLKGEPSDLIQTLKATAFKGQVSDAQMTALLIVSSQYGLNPWTKEIYAFPDKNNGIVPVVGVDGWARIINSHPQFDGMDFEFDEEFCTCTIYRKDRSRPIRVTEYMAECKRSNVGPWVSHPRRMIRHKAMIQCARLAFGFVGIYDQDEAERIREKDMGKAEVVAPSASDELVASAEAAANCGREAFTAYWKKLSKDDRGLLAGHIDRLKEMTEAADAIAVQPHGEVIDAEFVSAYDSEEVK